MPSAFLWLVIFKMRAGLIFLRQAAASLISSDNVGDGYADITASSIGNQGGYLLGAGDHWLGGHGVAVELLLNSFSKIIRVNI